MIKAVIIDDEKWTREVIKKFGNWTEYGIEIIAESNTGDNGIKIINKFSPDIVITDMNMPGANGIELLKEIEKNNKRPKIIVVSAYDNFLYTKQAIQSGVKNYILKPIDKDELNNTLYKCILEIRDEKYEKIDNTQAIERFRPELVRMIIDSKDILRNLFFSNSIESLTNYIDSLKAELKSSLNKQQQKESIYYIYESLSNCVIEQYISLGHHIDERVNTEKIAVENDLAKITFDQVFERVKYLYNLINIFVKEDKKEKDVLEQIKEYIEIRYSDFNINLEILSNNFFMSKQYLCRAFKKKFGVTVMEYLTAYRMETAKKLLETNPHITCNSVAEIVGYENTTYFFKVFKKYFGCSPNRIRN